MTQELLDRLRDFALSLPETSEVPSWGHPNFRAGKRTFAVYEIYHGRPCIAVKLPRPDGEALLTDPRFFSTPYIGKQGWVSLWVDRPVKWGFVKDLVLRSYREVATPGISRRSQERARSQLARNGARPAERKKRAARALAVRPPFEDANALLPRSVPRMILSRAGCTTIASFSPQGLDP